MVRAAPHMAQGIVGYTNTGLQGHAGTAKTTTVLKTVADTARRQGLTVRVIPRRG